MPFLFFIGCIYFDDSNINVDGIDVNYEDSDIPLDSSMEEKEENIHGPRTNKLPDISEGNLIDSMKINTTAVFQN